MAGANDDDVMQTIKQEMLEPNDPMVAEASNLGEGQPMGLGVNPVGPRPSPVNVQDGSDPAGRVSRVSEAKPGQGPAGNTTPPQKEVRFAPDTKSNKSRLCRLL